MAWDSCLEFGKSGVLALRNLLNITFQMEKIIFVFLDIWSTNICYIHNLCDLG